MSVAERMKEKAAKLRSGKTEKPTSKEKIAVIKKASHLIKSKPEKETKKEKAPRKTKVDVPWAKVVSMHNAGKSSREISDTLGYTKEKSNWPYSYTLGLLKRLRSGVNVNGKVLKIEKRKKAA